MSNLRRLASQNFLCGAAYLAVMATTLIQADETPQTKASSSDNTGPQSGNLLFQAIETADGPMLKVSVADMVFLTPAISFQHESKAPTWVSVVDGEVQVTNGKKLLASGQNTEMPIRNLNFHSKPSQAQELVRGIKRQTRIVDTEVIGAGASDRPAPTAIMFRAVKTDDGYAMRVATADIVFHTSDVSFQRHKHPATTIAVQEDMVRLSHGNSMTVAKRFELTLKSLSEGTFHPAKYPKATFSRMPSVEENR